jgi:uncharacterized paraquat-inducible protein A
MRTQLAQKFYVAAATGFTFNLCVGCTTIVENACVECDGAVYVPRSEGETPDYCPACRADLLRQTSRDPGWVADATSS